MVVITLQLGVAILTVSELPFVDFLAGGISLVSGILAIRYSFNAASLVLGAALIGWGASFFGYT